MRKGFRTAIIVVLSVGLLALFLRGANLGVVWTEMKRAEAPGYYDEFARLHDELRCGGSQRAADVVLDVAGCAR